MSNMEIVKFLKKFERMCVSHGDECIHCPFAATGNCLVNSPLNMEENEILQFIDIVEEWNKEHPIEDMEKYKKR